VGSPNCRANRIAKGQEARHLRDAALYITKLPKAEHEAPEWQAAMECLILVVEKNGPTIPYGTSDRSSRASCRVLKSCSPKPRSTISLTASQRA